jgi:hypothetical protein
LSERENTIKKKNVFISIKTSDDGKIIALQTNLEMGKKLAGEEKGVRERGRGR